MTCEGVLRLEPSDACDLGDELGCGESGNAVDLAQVVRTGLRVLVQLGGQGVDLDRELSDASNEVARDTSDDGVVADEVLLGEVEILEGTQAAFFRLPTRVDLVEVPPNPVDVAGPLGDEVLTVIDQQADLACFFVEVRSRKVGFTQRCSATASASIGSDLP